MSEIGHWIWTTTIFGNSYAFNLDTIFTMWFAMSVLIVVAYCVSRKLSLEPNKMQAVSEGIMKFFLSNTNGQTKHIPLVASLFLFILFANLMGQLPLRIIHLKAGELASPTNDINLTAGLALIVLVYYVTCGIRAKGSKFFLHEISVQGIIMMLVEFLEMITRPLSLAIRLFANVFAGEILVSIMLGLFAYFLPLPIMLFELLVAFIQATVFMMLTITYISSAEGEH